MASFANTNFTLSAKNISIPPKHIYKEALVGQSVKFIRRLTWRVFFRENPNSKTEYREFYGLKSQSPPPDEKELSKEYREFTHEFWKMIKNVKFRRDNITHKNTFQRNLKSKIANMTKNKNLVLIKGDKSQNWYQCPKDKYHNLVTNNLRKFYKKEPKNDPKIVEKINENIEKFGDIYDVTERIRKIKTRDVFLTLKDHKADFEINEPCRLINPTKSDLGVLSKFTLDKALTELRVNFRPKIDQFKNTNDCLVWFSKLQDFERRAFLTFDIVDFYPSISKDLLEKALFWARKHLKNGTLSRTDIDLILAARISILSYKGDIWIKKTGEFDVTMGSPDGAEVSELVGLYLLDLLRQKGIIPHGTFGLYRDDGIVALTTPSGRRQEIIRQCIRKFFVSVGLKVEISAAKPFVDYLDVRLHTNKTHEIYYKPNTVTTYVNTQSNHPNSVLKNFKNNTQNRLSRLNSDQTFFNKHANHYKEILEKSGHPSDLVYQKPDNPGKRKGRNNRRKRPVTWFNPPFNLDVKTNLGKQFFELCEKHFKKDGPLYFLTKKTVKLSYSTMGNARSIFSSHNKKALSNEPKTSENCKCSSTYAGVPRVCTIPEICNEKNVVYAARITEFPSNKKSVYFGMTKNPLKNRVNAHLRSFEDRSNKGKTKASRHIHDIKGRGGSFDVEWTVERRTECWNGGEACSLCRSEKTAILFSQEQNTLNQRKELFSTCPHQKKHKFPKKKPTPTGPGNDDEFWTASERDDDSEGDFEELLGQEPGEVDGRDGYSQNLFNLLERQKKKNKKKKN